MIKERYVSLEVARLLKDNGFDEECTKLYNINNGLVFEVDEIHNSELSEFSDLITRPTQAVACDWIRDKYKIHIAVRFRNKMGYVGSVCDISDPNNTLYMVDTKAYPEVESVYNTALECILTTMI